MYRYQYVALTGGRREVGRRGEREKEPYLSSTRRASRFLQGRRALRKA